MESPFKDLRIRMALTFAAFLLGSAYLAIVHHVLPTRRFIREVPATVAIVIGSIEAVLALPILVYAWKAHRRLLTARLPSRDREP